MKKLIAILTLILAITTAAVARQKTVEWQDKEVGVKIPKWVKKFDKPKKVASILKIDMKKYQIITVTSKTSNLQNMKNSENAILRAAVADKLAGQTTTVSNGTESASVTLTDTTISGLQKVGSFWVHYYDTKTKNDYYELYIVGTLPR
ncbi:hypothetical protein [Treponema zioleckii]|uniref:hypothetical protein n=1 Tax=Treponema zioleckii TaxID=331680 RepID=UPI00168B2319|nr:hypothetical protein [Treponema zioleckii]